VWLLVVVRASPWGRLWRLLTKGLHVSKPVPIILVALIVAHVARRRASIIYCSLNAIGRGWRYAFTYRSKLRQLFSLPEAPCADFLVHSCCCVCAISQEYRELKNRGVDPSIVNQYVLIDVHVQGWEANVEKWNREGIQVPPIPASTMTR
ncbi:hypothetical protein RJ640_017925, partial [Escallonia rubra]